MPADEPHDPLPGIRADLDQAIASFEETSRAYFAHFESLREAGFTEEQALRLTQTWMRAMISGTNPE